VKKLHEAIAQRKGEIGRNKARLTDAYQGFQKPTIFNGFVKTYKPVDADGEQLPGENKRVQRNVSANLNSIRESLNTLWDVHSSVERGNCDARGDIVVNGETILADVPVTSLLFFENQLTDLRTTVEKIPTLSPDFIWTKDENDGLYKTDVVTTHRNVKSQRAIVLYDATPDHPAQTSLIEEPKLAGYWHGVQHSIAAPATEKAALLSRVETLLDAVKAARARANSSEAPTVDTSPILNYIFG
jgi:hypothetical protein